MLLIVSGNDEVTIDEISAINEFIQKEAGNHTNIIMGIGEDESLDNAISVTIIATGFAVEMQQEIVHADPQKIIHSLDDEQRVTHDLNVGQIPLFAPEGEGTNAPKETVTHEDYVPTSDVIRSIDIQAEEVAARLEDMIAAEPTSFTIHDVTPSEMDIEVIDAEVVKPEEKETAVVDQPIASRSNQPNLESAVLFELEDDSQPVVAQGKISQREKTRLRDLFLKWMRRSPLRLQKPAPKRRL